MTAKAPDLLDRRQREAAALLLSAIDLPANLTAWALQIKQAARVCPGVTINQVQIGNRRGCLIQARGLIDEMLSEKTD
jgi:hypothetical protein